MVADLYVFKDQKSGLHFQMKSKQSKIPSNSKIRTKLGSSLTNAHVIFVTNDLSHAIFKVASC